MCDSGGGMWLGIAGHAPPPSFYEVHRGRSGLIARAHRATGG